MNIAYVDPDGRTWLIAKYEPLKTAVGVQGAEIVQITEQSRQGRAVEQQDAIAAMQYGKNVVFKGQMMKHRHSLFISILQVCCPFIEPRCYKNGPRLGGDPLGA